MSRFLLFFAFIFISATAVNAQREETVLGDKGLRFSGVWGGSNHQLSRFGNSNSYMRGGFFGLEFGKALQVGFSSYDLQENIKWDQVSNQPFEMYFRGLHLGYGLNNYKPVHPTFNIDIAPGRIKHGVDGSDQIFVVQPAVGVEINVLRWFHVGLQGGYRVVSDSDLPSVTDKALSGGFGQVSLKFGWSWGRGQKKKSEDKTKNWK
jgi:hypothetical protein